MAILPKIRLMLPFVAMGLLFPLISNSSVVLKITNFGLPDCLFNKITSRNSSCIPDDPEMKLIYATQNEIISIESDGKAARILKTNPVGSPRFVTADARTNSVFWSDNADYQEAVYKTVLNSRSSEIDKIFVDSNVYTPAGVAFDWITNNVYFVDTNLTYIAVCAQNPTNCRLLLIDNFSRPVDIALHPNDGVMFWTDIGSNPGIKKSSMDGSETETIITALNGSLLNGIAVDEQGFRIYWTDIAIGKIESSNFDGSDRKIIKASIDPFDVDVLGDLVFWSDSKTRKIMSANKITGHNETEVIVEHSATSLAGFTIMHSMKEQIVRTNSCENVQCSYICVLAKSEAVCLCPHGMLSNLTHCYTNINEPALLLVHKSKLLIMQLDKVGDNIFKEIRPPSQITDINAIVGNLINMTLIVSDAKLKQIVEFAPSILEQNKYSVLVDGIVNVSHIAIDLVSENLIWIDEGKETLEVMSLRSRRRRTVLSNVSNVHDIYFASDLMALILSRPGNNGYEEIVKMFLGSRPRQTTLDTHEQYIEPVQLFYDYAGKNIIFAAGNETELILHAFSNESTELLVGDYPGGAATDLVMFGHQIFWTDNTSNLRVLTSNGVEWCPHKISIKDSSNYDFYGNKLLTLLNRNMDHLDYFRANHDCSVINPNGKNCEHICLSVGIGFLGACVCADGYDLGEDQRSCLKHSEISYLPVEIRRPVEKKVKKYKNVPKWFWVVLTVLFIVLGSLLTFYGVLWWKSRTTLPPYIAEPCARFSQN